MKKTIKQIGIIALAAVIGFTFTACGSGGGGGDPSSGPSTPAAQKAVYESTDGVNTYTLTITQKLSGSSMISRAVYAAKAGDTYVLIINPGNKRSEGTVESNAGGEIKLKPAGANDEFTVTTSGDDMTGITGTIAFTGGSAPETVNTALTPVVASPSADPTKLRLSNVPVTYEEYGLSASEIAAMKAVSNFAYYHDNVNDKIIPLSDMFTGNPKVQVSGGKLTLELDAPKPALFEPITDWLLIPDGVTVNPADAKFAEIDEHFITSNYEYYLYSFNDEFPFSGVLLIYVDKDVNINGESTTVWGNNITIYKFSNVTLKRGWNYVWGDYEYDHNSEDFAVNTFTYKASQTRPSGSTWYIGW